MTPRNLLKPLAAVALAVQIAWFVLPEFEYRWIADDALTILSYGGFGTAITVPDWFYWGYFVATVVIVAAVFFVEARIRHILAAYFLGSIFLFVPFGGMVIETGVSMTLRDLGNLTVGALVIAAYLAHGQCTADEREV